MKRREFIRKGTLVSGGVGVGLSILSACGKSEPGAEPDDSVKDETSTYKNKLRFGICTDVHQDSMFGMPERLQEFIDEMNREEVDFIIQMGDFCYPIAANKPFLDIWNSFDGPKYHVLGNHDMDHHTKEEAMRFIGMPKAYYSFDVGGYHFVVLDLNNAKVGNTIVPYDSGNQNRTLTDLNYMEDRQLQWLEQDINSTNKRTVIFSHQTLIRELKNRAQFNSIIEKANAKYKKVFVAFSGHQHLNWMRADRGVQHIQINSMAFNWPGDGYFNDTRYSPEIYQKYPIMRNMWPYSSSLYGLVELDPVKGTLNLIGKKSTWVPPTPEQMGAAPYADRAPKIDSRNFSY